MADLDFLSLDIQTEFRLFGCISSDDDANYHHLYKHILDSISDKELFLNWVNHLLDDMPNMNEDACELFRRFGYDWCHYYSHDIWIDFLNASKHDFESAIGLTAFDPIKLNNVVLKINEFCNGDVYWLFRCFAMPGNMEDEIFYEFVRCFEIANTIDSTINEKVLNELNTKIFSDDIDIFDIYKKFGFPNETRNLQQIQADEYEHTIARFFFDKGYSVKKTPVTGDFGADLIMNDTISVQVKHYAKPVGPHAIQEVLGSMKHYGTLKAFVVANSGFTKEAVTMAIENAVELYKIPETLYD